MPVLKYYDQTSSTWKEMTFGPAGAAGSTGPTGPTGPQGSSANITKVTKTNVALGTISQSSSFTEVEITNVANRGIVTGFLITSSAATNYDIEVRSASSGGGSLLLQALNSTSTSFNMSNLWYFESDASESMFIRIRNNGATSTFTLTNLRLEKLN